MIQELTQYHIDTHNIVINFLVQDKGGIISISPLQFSLSLSFSFSFGFWFLIIGDCATCHHRALNQKKYLNQVDDLYEDFHVIKLPLQLSEVRGMDAIKKFSKMLLEPFDFEKGVLSES